MKKILLAIFLIFGILAFASYESNLRKKISNYERIRDEMVEERGGFGVEATNINQQFNDMLDEELTQVYNLIREKMSKTEKDNFRNKQRQWLKKREQQVEASTKDENGKGVIFGRGAANTEIYVYEQITKKRLFELAKMYDKMK